ncbi:hypothetical protein ABZY20_25795 [Streptomyces sp. NPDC006624]|uniref:hypothetical protein n=1 Tax=Streptomyces sp. NPDC006624 TaxID=3154892 RepID=UPI0033B608C8
MTAPRTPQSLRILWLGTSIMEHRQAHSPRLTDPATLAQVGETVRITEHRSTGYVHHVHLALQLAHPPRLLPLRQPRAGRRHLP